MKTLLMLSLLLAAACAPLKRLRDAYSGASVTVNGQPIEVEKPPAYKDRCQRLLFLIEQTLRSQHLKTLGVSVTEADLERVRNPPGQMSPEKSYRRNHPHDVALVKSWEAIEKGEDPAAVYERVLYPQRFSPGRPFVWAQGEVAGLEKLRRDPLVRKEFERRANQTLDEYLGEQASMATKQARFMAANPAAAATYNSFILNEATKAKLAEAIDELLSRSDPKFAAYLADSKRRVRTIFAQDTNSYLIDQREEYWFTKVRSQAKIVVNDPSLRSCDLSKYIGDAKAR